MDLNPLNQLDPVVIFGVIGIFVVTFVALRRVYVAPYVAVMQEREALFDEADARAAEAAKVRSEAAAEAASVRDSAREEAERLVAEATERAERYRQERARAGADAAAARLEEGRAQIARAREIELERLRAQATECVGLACERLLGTSERADIEAAVDRLLDRRLS